MKTFPAFLPPAGMPFPHFHTFKPYPHLRPNPNGISTDRLERGLPYWVYLHGFLIFFLSNLLAPGEQN